VVERRNVLDGDLLTRGLVKSGAGQKLISTI
jgi:hypothetical protein